MSFNATAWQNKFTTHYQRIHMYYYNCPPQELWKEIERRGFIPCGGHDELSEGLTRDDTTRGTDATTVATVVKDHVQLRSQHQMAEFGLAIHPSLLVGERIIHWNMNTFFPTLQLLFESGLSCTIEGTQLRDASMGIDSDLRFRLTDLTHEEDGIVVKSTLPEKFAGPTPSIAILEAVVADRISVSIKPVATSRMHQSARIEREIHTVIGLKLEGMSRMGYVWAKVDASSRFGGSRTWGDVTVGSLRDDIPAPFFGYPQDTTGMGASTSIVKKKSIIGRGRGRGRQHTGDFGNA